MGDPRGFIKVGRQESEYRPESDRLSRDQASRCMDCGTPFCNWGCPLGNYIPEWNDLLFNDQWEQAFILLNATNNLPEITGRLCPAHCEFACVLGVNDDPVTVRENELAIIEHAFKNGLIKPDPPKKRTNRKVAIVGSGPAGLSCAAELNKMGHNVVVFEKADKIGGIMRYGIPDFKLEKSILDRRIALMEKEGIEFQPGSNVGENYSAQRLLAEFGAVCLAGGSRAARDLKIPGRQLSGIYFAMDYLTQSNKRIAGQNIKENELIDAKGKKVVVIGGGDTGSDCVGTANRQGAACVVQIEVMPKPAECRDNKCPWPIYPLLLKTTSSHEEGVERQWAILTKKFKGQNSKVKTLECVKVEFDGKNMKEVIGSEFEIEADMVILAVGFLHPEQNGLLKQIGLEFDQCGNVKTNENYMTSKQGVFSAGDMRRGQSLIVWAIMEGRQAARAIDQYLGVR